MDFAAKRELRLAERTLKGFGCEEERTGAGKDELGGRCNLEMRKKLEKEWRFVTGVRRLRRTKIGVFSCNGLLTMCQ